MANGGACGNLNHFASHQGIERWIVTKPAIANFAYNKYWRSLQVDTAKTKKSNTDELKSNNNTFIRP